MTQKDCTILICKQLKNKLISNKMDFYKYINKIANQEQVGYLEKLHTLLAKLDFHKNFNNALSRKFDIDESSNNNHLNFMVFLKLLEEVYF